MGIITIARQTGSDGEAVADRVARDLGFVLVDRYLLESLVQEHGLTGPELDESDEERPGPGVAATGEVHVDYLQAVLLDLAAKQDILVVGRGGQFLFRDCPWSLHARMVADLKARRAALQRVQDLTDVEAEAMLDEGDRRRSEWIRQHYGEEWEDPAHYDLIVRTDRLGVEGAAAVIRSAAEGRGIGGHAGEIAAWIERRGGETPTERPEGLLPGFVHPSEAELARVLDFYRIRWEYEPKSFPLGWDEAGNVSEAFTPDFYLPDLDLFLELTTLKQSLVTDKNRKIRKFRELYPDIRLKVFYGRDFRSLVQKYGLPATAPGTASARGSEARPS
ncbi:MAG: cytidylate kinase-like family protein [candidate division NC10 bacterium]|nr:cytidylate kinase-like family protein [candidate division NC10 bacterium]